MDDEVTTIILVVGASLAANDVSVNDGVRRRAMGSIFRFHRHWDVSSNHVRGVCGNAACPWFGRKCSR